MKAYSPHRESSFDPIEVESLTFQCPRVDWMQATLTVADNIHKRLITKTRVLFYSFTVRNISAQKLGHQCDFPTFSLPPHED